MRAYPRWSLRKPTRISAPIGKPPGLDAGPATTTTGSDVNYLFFEVLPRLRTGVLVHVHDVPYPFEYGEQTAQRRGQGADDESRIIVGPLNDTCERVQIDGHELLEFEESGLTPFFTDRVVNRMNETPTRRYRSRASPACRVSARSRIP